jgi:hypothetical protein
VKVFYRGTKSNQGGTKEVYFYFSVRQEGSPKKQASLIDSLQKLKTKREGGYCNLG